MSKPNHQQLMLEITVLSAQGLEAKPITPLFSQHLRPFITLSTTGNGRRDTYKTVVDQVGGNNPTWGDKFSVPTSFNTSIYLQIFSKAFVVGTRRLGCCQIPVTDIFEDCRPAEMVHHLSYRVRARDGSRGNGVVNIALRLVGVEFGSVVIGSGKPSTFNLMYFPAPDASQIALGIPLTSQATFLLQMFSHQVCQPSVIGGTKKNMINNFKTESNSRKSMGGSTTDCSLNMSEDSQVNKWMKIRDALQSFEDFNAGLRIFKG